MNGKQSQRWKRIEAEVAFRLSFRGMEPIVRVPVNGREGPDISVNQLGLVINVKHGHQVPKGYQLEKDSSSSSASWLGPGWMISPCWFPTPETNCEETMTVTRYTHSKQAILWEGRGFYYWNPTNQHWQKCTREWWTRSPLETQAICQESTGNSMSAIRQLRSANFPPAAPQIDPRWSFSS